MLSADQVRARQRNGRLEITPLGKLRGRAHELATELLETTRQHEGHRYQELQALWRAAPGAPREVKLVSGLAKLIEDDSRFESALDRPPAELRRTLFLRAAELRRELAAGQRFDRSAALRSAAEALGVAEGELESGLFADLRSEQRLQRASRLSPDALIARYEAAQIQAVLLRAVRIQAHLECDGPDEYRSLFRQLKFRRLLFSLEREEGGYGLAIDGPYSLFDSVTKYGLQMALVLPALLSARKLQLSAELRWGKGRTPLRYELEHCRAGGDGSPEPAGMRDEVKALLEAFGPGRRSWVAEPARELLEAPGGQVLVPDLTFRRVAKRGAGGGRPVHLEVLGFWSREALWRRIEWLRSGWQPSLLLAASTRLRVSREALDEPDQRALYLYKGVLSPRALESHLEQFD